MYKSINFKFLAYLIYLQETIFVPLNDTILKKVGKNTFKKFIRFGLLGFTLVSIVAVYYLSNLKFDYDFEKFFPTDDPETAFFLEHRKNFESDNDFLMIAIERKQGIYNLNFLKDIDSLTNQLVKLPHVKFASSITNLKEVFFYQGGGKGEKPYFDRNDFDPLRDSVRISQKQELINAFVSADGKSVCIFLKHDDYLSKKKSDQLSKNIEALLGRFKFDDVHQAGRIVGQRYYIDIMSNEMILFMGAGALLVVVFLFIAFRSLWGILLPQAVILGAMLWLMGGMGFFNTPINIILTTTPSIMFVVSMSDVIHLMSRYVDALREGFEKFEAIKKAIREVGLATLLTSVTTSIGFFTLIFVQVEPIQKFGIAIGAGVLIAFILTYLLLPILFFLSLPPKFVMKHKEEHFWKKYLLKWFGVVLRRRSTIAVVWIVLMVVSVFGLLKIESNNFLMDDLPDDEPIKADFNFIDAHYGGARPFEMAVEILDTNLTVWDEEVLRELDSVERYLENTYGLVVKGSLAQLMKVMNRSRHLGNPEYYKIADSKKQLRKDRRNLRMVDGGNFINGIMDSTERITRINGNVGDLSNQVISERNVKLKAFLKEHTLDGKIKYTITGTAHLLDKNMSYLATSMVKGLTISVLIVALIIGLIYRSITILIISIVTNVIPLVFIAGVMGYLGVELKTSTAIIFTISFGIAVDDTIHFLGKFKHELLKGRTKLYALKRSYLTTGKAMILTSLILCAGFLLLVFSTFLGTFYLGLLLCLTLIVALLADITILPVLLYYFYRNKKN